MMQKYLSRGIDFQFDIRRNSNFHSYLTRRSNEKTFISEAFKDWHNLDNDIKNIKSLSFFKAKLKNL